MNGWDYLSIRIKSKELISKLKGLKIWTNISKDPDIEIDDDVFQYYDDEDGLPCKAPTSIEKLGDELFYFFLERYDDFDAANKIREDKMWIKNVQEVEWVYSGADETEDEEASIFEWIRS